MKTKIIGDFIRKVTNENNNTEITFEIKNWNYKRNCDELKKATYTIELSEMRSKRSIQQNAYLWELIGLINEHENGGRESDTEIYCMLLAKANAKCVYVKVLSEAVNTLREQFRALQVLETSDTSNGEYSVCKCYLGSSKMNKEEMGKLIEATLDYASKIGIETEFYKGVLW